MPPRLPRRPRPLLVVQLDDLGYGGDVFGLLVVLAEAYEAGEPQGVALAPFVRASRVHRRAGDLVGEHLDNHLRLDPHAGLYVALDARGLPLGDMRLAALPHLAPLSVAQTGADLGDGREDVALGVVGGPGEAAPPERGPPSPAVDVADDDAVHGILEVARLRPLELNPVVVARSGLVGRVGPLGDDALQTVLNGVVEY